MNPLEELIGLDPAGQRELLRQGLIVSVTEQIWSAMQAAGISKADLARKLGSSKSNVTQLLNGERNMTLATLADIVSAMGAKIDIRISEHPEARDEQAV